jgi:hypothetical protein
MQFSPGFPDAIRGQAVLRVTDRTPGPSEGQRGYFGIVLSTNATKGQGETVSFVYTYGFGARRQGCGLGTSWTQNESGFDGRLVRRGDSNVFDATWSGIGVKAVLTVNVSGNSVSIVRRQSNDGNDCEYTGTIQPDGITVIGTYTCTKFARNAPWRATIGCDPPPGGSAQYVGCFWRSRGPRFKRSGYKRKQHDHAAVSRILPAAGLRLSGHTVQFILLLRQQIWQVRSKQQLQHAVYG